MHHLKNLETFAEQIFTENDNKAWDLWHNKFHQEKLYSNETEKKERRNIWKWANDLIESHNKEFENGKQMFKIGHNKFSDYSSSEITKLFKGFNADLQKQKAKLLNFHLDTSNLPESVDWREKGYVNAVQDQGKYGVCYAFSSCAAIEGQYFRKSGDLVKLSEQNLIDGSIKMGNSGNGGTMNNCFEYVKENGGIELHSTYPFSGPVGTCTYKPENSGFTAGFTLTGYVDIPEGDELALTAAVALIGPISVGINASSQSFHLYESGIYFDSKCSHKPDHAVVIVGYGSEGYGKDYYIVRNSWGSDWGENGYIRMARNRRNFAGIAQMASFPVISDKNYNFTEDDKNTNDYFLRISKSTGAKTLTNKTDEKSVGISKSTGANSSNTTDQKSNDSKNNNLSISRSTGATQPKSETSDKKDANKDK